LRLLVKLRNPLPSLASLVTTLLAWLWVVLLSVPAHRREEALLRIHDREPR